MESSLPCTTTNVTSTLSTLLSAPIYQYSRVLIPLSQNESTTNGQFNNDGDDIGDGNDDQDYDDGLNVCMWLYSVNNRLFVVACVIHHLCDGQRWAFVSSLEALRM